MILIAKIAFLLPANISEMKAKTKGTIALANKIHFVPSKIIFSLKSTKYGIWAGTRKNVSKNTKTKLINDKVIKIKLFFFIFLQY